MDTIINIDKSIFYFFNGMHSPLFDVVMSLFTRTEYWMLFFFSIILFMSKRYGRKAIFILFVAAFIILIADQFSGLIKDLVGRLRPTHDPTMEGLVHFVKYKGGEFSYFSAHAANTFGIASFLSLLFNRKSFSILIFAWAAIASYTRIYLGLHFPGDILTGMIFGLLLGGAMYKFILFLDKRFFAITLPKLDKKQIETSDIQYMYLVFGCVLGTTFLIADRLLHLGLINL